MSMPMAVQRRRRALDRCQELGSHGGHGDLVPDIGFDIGQRDRVFLATEADGVTVGTGARGAPDPVHIVGGVLWQIEIEDMTHIRDVQPARGDVGRDQHRELPLVKLAQELQPFLLWHIARERLGAEAVGEQRRLEPLGHAPRIDKHHGAMSFGRLEQADQQWDLLIHRREVDQLADTVDRDLVGLDADQLRVVHVLVGEFEHALRQRR